MEHELNNMLCEYFAGKFVRKDLTKRVKEGANVPIYVLEYLHGMQTVASHSSFSLITIINIICICLLYKPIIVISDNRNRIHFIEVYRVMIIESMELGKTKVTFHDDFLPETEEENKEREKALNRLMISIQEKNLKKKGGTL